MQSNIIDLNNIVFGYQKNQPILKIDHFRVKPGEKVFLYGSSGTGKSTLLGLLTGVLSPWSGELSVLGQPFHKLKPRFRDKIRGEQIGYIFQSFNLLPSLNVRENILLPCHIRRHRKGDDDEKECDRILEALELSAYKMAKVYNLSVGQCQRVAVGRALIGSPKLIIADEPTSALDEDITDKFLDLLLAECEKRGSTVIFVSHNKKLASHFDRSINLKELAGGLA